MTAFLDGRDEKALISWIVVIGLHKMGVWAGQVCEWYHPSAFMGFSFVGHLLPLTVIKLGAPVPSEVGAVQGQKESNCS